MTPHRFSITTLAIFAVTLFVTPTWATPKEKILYSFTDGKDGGRPFADLTIDKAGNLYGTTPDGGTNSDGAVFELTPKASGGWTEKVLYSFAGGNDGEYPYSGLVFDPAGNLYGATPYGGTGPCHDTTGNGCGVVYELSPKTGGGWTEKVLYNFGSSRTDGTHPYSDLILDAAGNLYCTTSAGGTHNKGTAFELAATTDGAWTPTVLYSFTFNATNRRDGSGPQAGLVFDTAGNLYGTTAGGGVGRCRGGCGTVFELTPRSGGGWTETVQHSFAHNATDGTFPLATLIVDAAGNLYSTTEVGGVFDGGTVFELIPQTGGGWTETLLHSFGKGKDGQGPNGRLIFDPAGNLYSTTAQGGYASPARGTVFELSPKSGGWAEKLLHSFGAGTDGTEPFAGLVRDASGNLYGTTGFGGTHNNNGTVFQVIP